MSLQYARIAQYHRSFDRDASLYCGLLNTAGAPITVAKKQLISDFIEAEKTAGRWTLLKYLYLPVWGVAAANARCLKTRTSGSFTATGVTHASGYVQSDGTGYFDTLVVYGSFFNNTENIVSGFLNTTAANGNYLGVGAGTSTHAIGHNFVEARTVLTQSITSVSGITMGWWHGSNVGASRRTGSGYSELGSTATTKEGSINGSTVFCMARNNSNTGGKLPVNITTARQGAWFTLDGLTAAQREAFSLNLETLYEGLTGISLP